MIAPPIIVAVGFASFLRAAAPFHEVPSSEERAVLDGWDRTTECATFCNAAAHMNEFGNSANPPLGKHQLPGPGGVINSRI
jgi:hypothetical protein